MEGWKFPKLSLSIVCNSFLCWCQPTIKSAPSVWTDLTISSPLLFIEDFAITRFGQAQLFYLYVLHTGTVLSAKGTVNWRNRSFIQLSKRAIEKSKQCLCCKWLCRHSCNTRWKWLQGVKYKSEKQIFKPLEIWCAAHLRIANQILNLSFKT